MTTDYLEAFRTTQEDAPRKPRIALMGEFSAGKSTLLNMLLTHDPLPVRITATSVPPVWMSYGEEAAVRVKLDGTEEPIDIADIASIGPEDTRFIRLWLEADALEICDLLDMPGISDPNMAYENWQAAFDNVDSVIWCTHATQAWRQSEAATWEQISDRTNGNNILVITQFDKIVRETDRARLLARVRKETEGLFRQVFPLALIDAINAEDKESWKKSGAAEFSNYLVEMLLQNADATAPAGQGGHAGASASAREATDADGPSDHAETPSEGKIVPRRVTRRHSGRPRTGTMTRNTEGQGHLQPVQEEQNVDSS